MWQQGAARDLAEARDVRVALVRRGLSSLTSEQLPNVLAQRMLTTLGLAERNVVVVELSDTSLFVSALPSPTARRAPKRNPTRPSLVAAASALSQLHARVRAQISLGPQRDTHAFGAQVRAAGRSVAGFLNL